MVSSLEIVAGPVFDKCYSVSDNISFRGAIALKMFPASHGPIGALLFPSFSVGGTFQS